MNALVFLATGETDTERLGKALATALPDHTTVALLGTLGAGKTRLVQAVADACEIPSGEVVSPTFTLCNEYRGRRTIYHFDAYRLRDDDEFLELGPDEYFDAPALTFVEWADRVAACLPRRHVEIAIEITGETERTFRITFIGDNWDAARAALSHDLTLPS
jgi:tRNA threonylcarbamoyladenosine biosynthesis protein TsaE